MHFSLEDAYTYVAMERNSKLILAWHLGKRNKRDTLAVIIKLRRAMEGKFQLTTDGWPSYPDAVERVFGSDIHYARLSKSAQLPAMESNRTRPLRS